MTSLEETIRAFASRPDICKNPFAAAQGRAMAHLTPAFLNWIKEERQRQAHLTASRLIDVMAANMAAHLAILADMTGARREAANHMSALFARQLALHTTSQAAGGTLSLEVSHDLDSGETTILPPTTETRQ